MCRTGLRGSIQRMATGDSVKPTKEFTNVSEATVFLRVTTDEYAVDAWKTSKPHHTTDFPILSLQNDRTLTSLVSLSESQ